MKEMNTLLFGNNHKHLSSFVSEYSLVFLLINKLDLYVGIHKGQRRKFSEIMMKAGSIDYSNKESLEALHSELTLFANHMRLHASLEERFIHPVLSERLPGGARELEEEHRIMHQYFDDLTSHLERIRTRSASTEMLSELVLEFYRAWNRFIAFYFTHINKEEENIQPMLWKICTADELVGIFRTILSSQNPDELKYDFQLMLPAMNIFERAETLNAGKASMPPQAFQGFLKLAENTLSPDEWTALKARIQT